MFDEPTIIHADLDAFYASVEQLLEPKLRGKPVLVGGGIVVAASYEARAFGVRAPMPLREALALCPRAVVVNGHFEHYLELSDKVMEVLGDATPVVEQISVDEAFLDNPAGNPPEEALANMFYIMDVGEEAEQLYNDAWDEVKILAGS